MGNGDSFNERLEKLKAFAKEGKFRRVVGSVTRLSRDLENRGFLEVIPIEKFEDIGIHRDQIESVLKIVEKERPNFEKIGPTQTSSITPEISRIRGSIKQKEIDPNEKVDEVMIKEYQQKLEDKKLRFIVAVLMGNPKILENFNINKSELEKLLWKGKLLQRPCPIARNKEEALKFIFLAEPTSPYQAEELEEAVYKPILDTLNQQKRLKAGKKPIESVDVFGQMIEDDLLNLLYVIKPKSEEELIEKINALGFHNIKEQEQVQKMIQDSLNIMFPEEALLPLEKTLDHKEIEKLIKSTKDLAQFKTVLRSSLGGTLGKETSNKIEVFRNIIADNDILRSIFLMQSDKERRDGLKGIKEHDLTLINVDEVGEFQDLVKNTLGRYFKTVAFPEDILKIDTFLSWLVGGIEATKTDLTGFAEKLKEELPKKYQPPETKVDDHPSRMMTTVPSAEPATTAKKATKGPEVPAKWKAKGAIIPEPVSTPPAKPDAKPKKVETRQGASPTKKPDEQPATKPTTKPEKKDEVAETVEKLIHLHIDSLPENIKDLFKDLYVYVSGKGREKERALVEKMIYFLLKKPATESGKRLLKAANVQIKLGLRINKTEPESARKIIIDFLFENETSIENALKGAEEEPIPEPEKTPAVAPDSARQNAAAAISVTPKIPVGTPIDVADLTFKRNRKHRLLRRIGLDMYAVVKPLLMVLAIEKNAIEDPTKKERLEDVQQEIDDVIGVIPIEKLEEISKMPYAEKQKGLQPYKKDLELLLARIEEILKEEGLLSDLPDEEREMLQKALQLKTRKSVTSTLKKPATVETRRDASPEEKPAEVSKWVAFMETDEGLNDLIDQLDLIRQGFAKAREFNASNNPPEGFNDDLETFNKLHEKRKAKKDPLIAAKTKEALTDAYINLISKRNTELLEEGHEEELKTKLADKLKRIVFNHKKLLK